MIRSTNVRVCCFLAFVFVPLTRSCSLCRVRVSVGNFAGLPFPHSNHTDKRQRRADRAASVVRSMNVCVRSFLAFTFLPLTRSCSLCPRPCFGGQRPTTARRCFACPPSRHTFDSSIRALGCLALHVTPPQSPCWRLKTKFVGKKCNALVVEHVPHSRSMLVMYLSLCMYTYNAVE